MRSMHASFNSDLRVNYKESHFNRKVGIRAEGDDIGVSAANEGDPSPIKVRSYLTVPEHSSASMPTLLKSGH